MDKVVEAEGSIYGKDGDVVLTAPQEWRGAKFSPFLVAITRIYLDSDDPSTLLSAFLLDSEGDVPKS